MQFGVERRYRPRYLCARRRFAHLKPGLFKNLLYIKTSLAHRCHESPRIEALIFGTIDGNCARRRGESYKGPGGHIFRRKASCQRLATCGAKSLVACPVEYDDPGRERCLRQFVGKIFQSISLTRQVARLIDNSVDGNQEVLTVRLRGVTRIIENGDSAGPASRNLIEKITYARPDIRLADVVQFGHLVASREQGFCD